MFLGGTIDWPNSSIKQFYEIYYFSAPNNKRFIRDGKKEYWYIFSNLYSNL